MTFLVSPLWGALADVTGMHQQIMVVTFIGSVAARCAIMVKSNIYWLAFLVAFSAVLNAPVKPLMDSAVMSMLQEKSSYGKSRLFGQLGFGFGSYLVGPLLKTHMRLMFPAHALIAIPTAIVMLAFTPKPQETKERTKILKAVQHVILDPNILIFFSVVFLIGLSSGIAENFAYVRIAEVGGVGHVLGVCRLVSSIAGCPTFWLSGQVSYVVLCCFVPRVI